MKCPECENEFNSPLDHSDPEVRNIIKVVICPDCLYEFNPNCRLCCVNNVSELYGRELCEQHKTEMQSNLDMYSDKQIIDMIMHRDKKLEKYIKRFVRDILKAGEREEYLLIGYPDEDFSDFVINSFWHTHNIDPEDQLIDQLNYKQVLNRYNIKEYGTIDQEHINNIKDVRGTTTQ